MFVRDCSANDWFELPTAEDIHLSSSPSLRQYVLRGHIWRFESGHNFPFHSPQDDTFLFNSPNVDVGSRSRNTIFYPRTRGQKKKRSNRSTKLVSCLTRPCLFLYILALARAFHWYYQRDLRSFLMCRRSLQQARIHHSFLRILRHHSLPQARALHSLKLQLIQQDCMSLYTAMRLYLHLPSEWDLLIRCNSDPVGRCCPGQQHGRPLPLLPHNGKLVDRPLSSAVVGRERALR